MVARKYLASLEVERLFATFLHPKHLQHLIPVKVDHLHGDLAGV